MSWWLGFSELEALRGWCLSLKGPREARLKRAGNLGIQPQQGGSAEQVLPPPQGHLQARQPPALTLPALGWERGPVARGNFRPTGGTERGTNSAGCQHFIFLNESIQNKLTHVLTPFAKRRAILITMKNGRRDPRPETCLKTSLDVHVLTHMV